MTELTVKLIAHTSLSEEFYDSFDVYDMDGGGIGNELDGMGVNDRAAVALTAIRTCYSPGKPSDIVKNEGERYFGKMATDGEGGSDADRLFRQIFRSKHLSTLEHLSYTFAVEGLSRAALAQLTRHRVGFSFSVQSQRYVRMGSDDKSGGFDYVTPPSISEDRKAPSNDDEDFYVELSAKEWFDDAMRDAQYAYDRLRAAGVPPEDARMVLPNAAACNLVMTGNLRAFLDFYGKRQVGRGAQWEIAALAEDIRKEITAVDAWTGRFFDEV